MTRIPSDLHRFGLKVELLPGWESRGSASFAPAAVVDHWTAGPRGTKGRPSLNVVTNGRTGIPGPLCNVYLARDGTCVVVAAGRANHAGTGGWRGLVGNSAVYGIEAESGGDGDWTPQMLDVYPRLNAALLSGLGRDASWVCGHHEWAPNRKVDIRDIIGRVRADTATSLSNQGDDMLADEREALFQVRDLLGAAGALHTPTQNTLGFLVRDIAPRVKDTQLALTNALPALLHAADSPVDADVDEAALAAAIAAAIPAGIAQQVVDHLGDRLTGKR